VSSEEEIKREYTRAPQQLGVLVGDERAGALTARYLEGKRRQV